MGSGNGLSPKEKKLSVVLGAVAAIAIGLLIAVIVVGVKLHNKNNEDSPETPGPGPEAVCSTPACALAAADLLRAMDTSVKPCEDFYKFSCGGWIKTHPIPSTSSSWSQFNVLREELSVIMGDILSSEIVDEDPVPLSNSKKYYDTCLKQGEADEKDSLKATITELVEDVQGSPVKELGVKLGDLRREVSGNYLVNLYVDLDEEDTFKYTIYLDQPSLGLNRAFHLGTPENNNIVAYRDLIRSAWALMYPEDNANDIADQVLLFEKTIAGIMTAPENRRNRTAMYNPMQLQEFSDLVEESGENPPLINWEAYISSVFSKVGVPANLPTLTVIVRDIAYFTDLVEGVKGFPNFNEALGNYLKWRVIFNFGNDVGKPLRDIFFEYTRKTQGTQNAPKRTKTCADGSNTYYGIAISYKYVQLVFGPDFHEQIDSMVEDLRESFIQILDETEWIGTEETRTKAKSKAEVMKQFIGYPNWLLTNSSALIEYYKDLTAPTESHYQNYRNAINWRVSESLKRLPGSKDPDRWLTDPTVVNAFYSSTYNSISFPAGILQPPFYFSGKPIQSLNYGAIGMVMGHEITHGFDDRGRQSDGDGNLNNWWDDTTLENYLGKAQCFVDQYSSYEAEGLVEENGQPVKLNGQNTLGENIADNGGVREAFKAYKSFVAKNGQEPKLPGLEYTPEQLFFLSFAQIWCGAYTPESLLNQIKTGVHSPNLFRVRGVLQNSVEFAETWGCPLPDQTTRCQIW